jgi:hypothetical protein
MIISVLWTQNKIVYWIYVLNQNQESSNLLFNSESEVLHKSKELPNTDLDLYVYTREENDCFW